MSSIDDVAVVALFSGKALEAAKPALKDLHEAITLGYWPPNKSRKTRAALTKANEPKKLIKTFVKAREKLFDYSGDRVLRDRLRGVASALQYPGLWGDALVGVLPMADDERALFAAAKTAHDAMLSVYAALRVLDNTRPKPVITEQQASPTVTKTMNDLGALKIELCPGHWEEDIDAEGRRSFFYVLDWPAGTVFSTSRFTGRHQCQACGHSIHNVFNWLPLVVTPKGDAAPRALWVGKDCGFTLFGFKVSGVFEIRGDRKGFNGVTDG